MLRLVETEMEGEMLPTLDELAREGARMMLTSALEAEVAAYLEAHRDAPWWYATAELANGR